MFCNVYIIRNTQNNKVYIGQTWKCISNRLREHIRHRNDKRRRCTKLANAMNKYGINNFNIELLTIIHTQTISDYWENYFIEKYDSINNGYNIKNGGSKGRHSAETAAKISKALKGKEFSKNHRENISKSRIGKPNFYMVGNTIWLGKTHSEETKQKLREINKGKRLSKETKLKISKVQLGKPKFSLRKFTEEIEKQICLEYIGKMTFEQLSKKYNTSIATIHRVVKRGQNEF